MMVGYVACGAAAGQPCVLQLDELVELLYNLDRKDLRRLAYEALLISDGPDQIGGDVDGTVIGVDVEPDNAFTIYEREPDVLQES